VFRGDVDESVRVKLALLTAAVTVAVADGVTLEDPKTREKKREREREKYFNSK
jgi:hypothetical protein